MCHFVSQDMSYIIYIIKWTGVEEMHLLLLHCPIEDSDHVVVFPAQTRLDVVNVGDWFIIMKGGAPVEIFKVVLKI